MANIKLKIKLTEEGINYLKEKYAKAYENVSLNPPSIEDMESEEFEVKIDEDGYSTLDLSTIEELYHSEVNYIENEDIQVKLNQNGINILKKVYLDDYYFTNRVEPSDEVMDSEEFEIKMDEDGYTHFKLYDFLNTFGSNVSLDICDEIKVVEKDKIK